MTSIFPLPHASRLVAAVLVVSALWCSGCADSATNASTTTLTFPNVGSSYRHRVTTVDSATGHRSVRIDTTRVVATGLMVGGRENVVHMDSGHLYGHYLFQTDGNVARIVYLFDPLAFRAVDSAWQIMPFHSRDTMRLSMERLSSGKQLRLSIEGVYIGTDTRVVGSESFTSHAVRLVRTSSIGSPGGGLDFSSRSIDTILYAPKIFGFVRWAVADRSYTNTDTTGRSDVSELEGYVVR